MPPRIQSRRVPNALLPYLNSSPSSSSASSLPSLCTSSSKILSRHFSVTPASQTKLRREMFDWLNSKGAAYKHHIPGQTNYLPGFREESGEGGSKHPFPSNRAFVSESVLSEELRNKVYDRVALHKASVRAVSAELGIDMRRVAAVVRLVELEKRQREQVSFLSHLPFPSRLPPRDAYDESTKKSISLEDSGISPDWLKISLFI